MDKLKVLLDKISHNLVEVYDQINEYEFIFNEDPETKGLIEDIGSSFFVQLYWLFWNSFTIKICALQDRPYTGGRENATLPRLINEVEARDFVCALNLQQKTGQKVKLHFLVA